MNMLCFDSIFVFLTVDFKIHFGFIFVLLEHTVYLMDCTTFFGTSYTCLYTQNQDPSEVNIRLLMDDGPENALCYIFGTIM